MIFLLVLASIFPPRPTFLADTVMYLSPIDPDLYISSTFAETRTAHFHAAIDYGTQGRTGYPLYASRSGVLHRVLMSPLGYGYALYLKHYDGSFTVYAHMRNFAPNIERVVDSIRVAESIFLFDRVMESYDIRFNAGDVIGWSGDTGAGPAHLHFEVRSPSNHAINPFLVGFDMADKVPPRFQGVAIEPLHESTLIQGRRANVLASISADGTDYRFSPITTTGPVGLAVQVSDRSDHMRNVFAVYKLELQVNEELVFASQVDSFPMQNQHMMFLDRVYPLLQQNRRAFQRLHLHDGNTLPFYQAMGNGGKLDLPLGRHEISIIAYDIAGNTSRMSGVINRIEPKSDVAEPESFRMDGHRQHLHPSGASVRQLQNRFEPYNNWLVLKQSVDSVWVQDSVFYPTLDRGLAVPLPTDVKFDDIMFHRIQPSLARFLATPNGRMTLDIPEDAVYDTLSLAFGYWEDGDQIRMQIWQPLEPFRRSFRLGFNNGFEPGAGIYRMDGNGKNQTFAYIGSNVSGPWLSASTSSPGLFTILVDTIPPAISNPRISRRGNQSVVSVTIRDERSGVNWSSARISVNGVRGIPETDFQGRLTFFLPGWRPSGQSQIEVYVKDRMGNESVGEFSLP
jgi:hypothetical protein